MASSNRHWPSMFKSKPCNNNQQWSQHHDNNSSLLSNSCARSSGSGEERSPEPKPRWNPKPEQIRILEAIFNSGMVNPPRDEIRRIRAQLQEYGQVGDANVFYWFQNRKSRSKYKQRSLQGKTTTKTATATATVPVVFATSSSDKNNSSSSNNNNNNNNNYNILGGENYSSSSNNNSSNNFFHAPQQQYNHISIHEVISLESNYFPLQQSGAGVLGNNYSQGLCFSNNNAHHDHMVNGSDSSNETIGGLSSLLLGDVFNGGGVSGGGDGDNQLKRDDELEKFKFQQELSFFVSTQNATTCSISSPSPVVSMPTSSAISGSIGHILGIGETGKSTVFINGVAFTLENGPFNVKEEFGEEVMLVNSATGQPIVTDEWGVTLNSLQNGASYYLVGVNNQGVASPLLDKLDTNHHLLDSDFPYQI